MTTKTKKITINGTQIKITVSPVATRFGERWVAENDYGEPRVETPAYATAAKAFAAEIAELKEMLESE